jgi:hypothetical protein
MRHNYGIKKKKKKKKLLALQDNVLLHVYVRSPRRTFAIGHSHLVI